MKQSKLTLREIVLICTLVVLLLGLAYYMLFYKPLQEELTALSVQCDEVDREIRSSTEKIAKKKQMEQQIEEILSRPKDEIMEIADYDNKDVVLNMLYGILGRTNDYSLSFSDPAIGEDGTVRRNISMSFACDSYEAAKAVIQDLNRCPWRCQVSACNLSGTGSYLDEETGLIAGGIMNGSVSVSLTVTFFESTNLK